MEFCIGGNFKSVVVDDHIPTNSADRPAFCYTNDEEMWAIPLEKAFAKLHGNYECMQGGKAGMALHLLTGEPNNDFMHGDVSQLNNSNGMGVDGLWKRFISGEKRNYVMSAGTGGAGEQDIDGSGIASGHAYTMISAHDVVDANGKPWRLVKMRNPWGRTEFTGDWKDDDDNHWTPELRSELGCVEADDGIFFMPLEDYLKYFDNTSICFDCPDTYKEKRIMHDGRNDAATVQVLYTFSVSETVNLDENPVVFECI